jgi:hypothetical protein
VGSPDVVLNRLAAETDGHLRGPGPIRFDQFRVALAPPSGTMEASDVDSLRTWIHDATRPLPPERVRELLAAQSDVTAAQSELAIAAGTHTESEWSSDHRVKRAKQTPSPPSADDVYDGCK